MLTLILDSSMGFATAVVAEDRELKSVQTARGRTLSLLHELSARTMADVGVTAQSLDMVTTIVGPGSWTGLHVCMTAAKTVAQIVDVPLLGISMIECLAASFRFRDGLICATVDAKHHSHYSGLYSARDGVLSSVLESQKRDEAALAKEIASLGEDVLFVGDMTEEQAGSIGARAKVKPIVTGQSYPSPQAFISVAYEHREEAVVGESKFAMAPAYGQDDFTITPRKGTQ